MDQKLYHQSLKRAQTWLTFDHLERADKEFVQKLIDEDNQKEIIERFYDDLAFGTGGIRSFYGLGSAWINKYTVCRITNALALTLKSEFPNEQIKICLSFDSRLSSPELKEFAIKMLLSHEIEVFEFDRPTPVPLLCYSIAFKQAHAGVMITASHNPKDYNGYKIYWNDLCQVTPPIDQKIVDTYKKEFTIAPLTSNFSKRSLINKSCFQAYSDDLFDNARDLKQAQDKGHQLSIVYTALHGTGHHFVKPLAEKMGFENFHSIESQAEPDGHFPTIEHPNPEYPDSLKLATNELIKRNADLVVASDTDTDRLGVAYLHNNDLCFLNGNDIAILMLEFTIRKLKEFNKLPNDALVIKTIVTSELQRLICEKNNVEIHDTLTGFKWMGALRAQFDQENKPYSFIFSSEESYGYLPNPFIRDKDGISAVLTMIECALDWKIKGKNLQEALIEIYKEYGFLKEKLYNFFFHGQSGKQKIQTIMDHFRNVDSFNSNQIIKIDDYLSSITTDKKTSSKKEIKNIPSSNVLRLHFIDGDCLCLRPSGTEPKIKLYLQVRSENDRPLEDIQEKMISYTKSINHFMENLK